MESHCLHFAYSEVGHPGIMTYRRGLLYYIIPIALRSQKQLHYQYQGTKKLQIQCISN